MTHYLHLFVLFAAGHLLAQNNANSCVPKLPGPSIGDTGCVAFSYRHNTLTHNTVRAADGHIWLQQNLGSQQTGTQIDDNKAFGDYFQWGRWDDGHQLSNSEVSEDYPQPNNPVGLGTGSPYFFIHGGSPWASNYVGWWANPDQNDLWTAKTLQEVTANNGLNPCTALGEHWEIPTEADWKNVMEKEGIAPKREGDNRDGITRALESHLKIVGNGARKNETWAFPGERAYIWTRTASTSPNFYRYAYISKGMANFGGDAKNHGYAVRCMLKDALLENQELLEIPVLTITPNPANQHISIQTNYSIAHVKIHSLSGQLLISKNTSKIDIATLAAGVYVVTVELDNGELITKKLIKK